MSILLSLAETISPLLYMNTDLPSTNEIRNLTHSLVDRRRWAEKLLSQVQAMIHVRGKDRIRELRQLELTIRLEIEDTRMAKPLYHFICDHTEKLREVLSARYNALSDNDLFLCACIYLGINTTDIAEIRNMAASSVTMSRYRLKKKFGLTAKDDLDVYIQNSLKTLTQ